MNNDAFNQGLTETARNHYADQPSIFLSPGEVDAWIKERDQLKRSVSPYQPGTVIEYAPPPPKPYDIPGELQPYTSDAEAWKDLGVGLAKLGVVAVGGTVIVGGAVWVWNALTATAVVAGAATSAASSLPIGGLLFALVVVASLLSGVGGGAARAENPGAINQAAAQNITVITNVNVTGGTVTTNSTGK